jgi:5-hydroxyisourate hydrolase-like protein (transthyretin family)
MQINKLIPLFIISLSIFTFGCNLGSDNTPELATAIISAEFVFAESGEPLSETTILVSAAFDESDELIEQGTVETNEDGKFESPISNPQETVITLLEFSFELDEETITITEEVNLELTFESPYDEVELTIEIDTENGGDEE